MTPTQTTLWKKAILDIIENKMPKTVKVKAIVMLIDIAFDLKEMKTK